MTRESIPSLPTNLAAAAGESHGESINSIDVWEVAVAELATVLPHAFSRLSPTRACLLTEQIREILRSESEHRLVCIAASSGQPILEESVMAIAILAPDSDTATVLHVDWAQPDSRHRRIRPTVRRDRHLATLGVSESHGAAIWRKLESIFSLAHVRFVQWATDAVSPQPLGANATSVPNAEVNSPVRMVSPRGRMASSIAQWPEAMNFTQIGTLQYLSLDRDAAGTWDAPRQRSGDGDSAHRERRNVIFEPLDQAEGAQTAAFEQLVEQTYVDSLDCPPLAQFRTAHEIIRGYRSAATYTPELWYTVAAVGDPGDEPIAIGCVVLARHPAPSAASAPSAHPSEPIHTGCVIELVYMGIVPEYRGRDYGQAMIGMIAAICQQQAAERLILAVDQANAPALAAYRRSGMLRLFRETVWGRSVV